MCIERDVYVLGDMHLYIELVVYGHEGAVYKYIPISIGNYIYIYTDTCTPCTYTSLWIYKL